ncbi:MYXO-CTERM sorting domain-containing protein [Nannocystis sp.]|uniref:MYXO-CTERM sorting domain-containing protein n=1 Tax=Nannocystis sp. TaxID=1962667 RepID=UPI0025EF9A82|nr:MYXO-CTERM sorting domain-containing protein [Nannocystis sp.]MBK7829431.1 hypothetical protein [Nannocystis sp.]
MNLAGESIVLRFRVGTDAAAGAHGWDIDNIRLTGVDNTPFPSGRSTRPLCAETGDSAASTTTAATTATSDDSDTTPLPTDSGANNSVTLDADDGGVDSSNDSANALDDDGCGCRNDPQPRPPLALAALLLLTIRRRRA